MSWPLLAAKDGEGESGAKKLKTVADIVTVDVAILRTLVQEQASGIMTTHEVN